jgi:hypothetical protein
MSVVDGVRQLVANFGRGETPQLVYHVNKKTGWPDLFSKHMGPHILLFCIFGRKMPTSETVPGVGLEFQSGLPRTLVPNFDVGSMEEGGNHQIHTKHIILN